MGLDMYLIRKTYIGADYDHRNVTGKIDIKINGKKIPIDFKKVVNIEEKAAYWRKANHIHKWFVDNVQDGVDECQESYVSREQLQNLCDVCRLVLNSKGKKGAKKIAEENLPPQKGFFFGDNKIDDYYYDDIKYTLDTLFPLLVTDAGGDFCYRASW